MSGDSRQGATPSVDKRLANVADDARDKKATVTQDGRVHTPLRLHDEVASILAKLFIISLRVDLIDPEQVKVYYQYAR